MIKKDKLYFVQKIEQVGLNEKFKVIDVCNVTRKLLIHTKYGLCKSTLGALLKNKSVKIRSAINKTEYFINQAKEIHKDKYDYSLVEYKNAKTKVKIICKEHGVFEITANNHLSKHGCIKCQHLNNKIKFSNNPTGWNKTNWYKAAQKSKMFESFKVYIIKCWNENEDFYKIGRTFLSIHNRFKSLSVYNYKTLQVFEFQELTEENANKVFDLETELKNKNKEFKYIPLINFKGKQECFSQIKN